MRFIKIQFITIICFGISLHSCTDVIDVDLIEGTSKLVIEASIDWEKGTQGNQQTIKLSMSGPYFERSTNPVTGATVIVTNTQTKDVFNFTDQENGQYTVSDFLPIIDDTYVLNIQLNGETYTATETFMSVPEFSRIEQSLEGGFDDEALEVTFYFNDPEGISNYYLSSFQAESDLLPRFFDFSDEFTDGNELFNFYEKEDEDSDDEPFVSGDKVRIHLYGISEQYFNYMQLLLEQYNSGGDPYSAIPAQLKGNCINSTNPSNTVFGYFRLTEFVEDTFVFE